MTPQQRLLANGLMLLTAAIWGFAFVGQRMGLEHLGPFSFNGLRFLLGAFFLLPLLWLYRHTPSRRDEKTSPRLLWLGGLAAGLVLFAGASFQQIGLLYTTAGKAGFITGLYIVLVPMIGLFIGQQISRENWLGALLAVGGLYLLSINDDFSMGLGDALQLLGALFWAAHVLLIGWLSPRLSAIRLSVIQFGVTGVLSLLIGVRQEPFTLQDVIAAWQPLLYLGLMATAVAYTLQVVAQQWASPSQAAIILSLEAVFAVLGGWWLLDEQLAPRALLGCALMLGGMILAQLTLFPTRPPRQPAPQGSQP